MVEIGMPTEFAGNYRIEREIGRGGMAVVYRAHDERHDRTVALKMMNAELGDAQGADRFLVEIRLAARLNHPHIVALYDSGKINGQLYYVMPFIKGPSLREYITKRGKLPPEEALKFAAQIASALDHAHRLNVVHRDIKPENVMIYEGSALVTDFGIAKAISSAKASNLTQTGTSIGTPAYMSPEQALGETDLDGRSDQYSLACVVYEMLTGEAPFSGDSPQGLVARRFTYKPPSLRQTVRTLSDTAASAVSRALSLEPGDRFATAAEFGAALAARARDKGLDEVKPSIAVLPFSNMTANDEDEFFSDGVTEEIINSLSKIQALEVVSRRSAFTYKGRDLDMREIGSELGVKSLLAGSVRRSGKRLRISAELIDVATGYHLWSERFDREMSDIFAIQDEIAANIVDALRLVLTEREQAVVKSARTGSVRAYEYYLRGRQLCHVFGPQAFEAAEESFRRAIALDPSYALAYASLAEASATRDLYFTTNAEAVEQAVAASQRAVELDPNLAEAHAAHGLALMSLERPEEAEAELVTAMDLDPTLFDAPYTYGRLHLLQGKSETAVKYFEIAANLNHDDYQALTLAAGIYRGLNRTDEMNRAAARAVDAMERALVAQPRDARARYLGAGMLGILGRDDEANQWAVAAEEIAPDDPPTLYNLACFHAIAGRGEKALDLLERGEKLGWNRFEWASQDADLNSIREHPRFVQLLDRLKASVEAAHKTNVNT
ncbi:MAG TPA: protein kinase [Gemmatimonadaceae bacterium]|nr:protein kinase [Gemmatimonadaceae bacterium]